MRALLIPLSLLLPGLTACQPLIHEPWTRFPEDTVAAGVMVGWNATEADLRITGDMDSGGPIEDEDLLRSFDTRTVFDLGVEGDYYLTTNWLATARIEWRSNIPEDFSFPFSTISYDFEGEEYVTQHYALGLRYLFDPIGRGQRYRSFLGAELSYVPEVKTSFEVESSLNQTETVDFEGDGYYVLGARGGMSVLLTDESVLELGILWEWPLGSSEDTVTFGDGENGANPSRTAWDFDPDTIVLFMTLKGAL